MQNYPSFPNLQEIFKAGNEDTAQRKPWKPRNSRGFQEQQNFIPCHTYSQSWNPQVSWQPWSSPNIQNPW